MPVEQAVARKQLAHGFERDGEHGVARGAEVFVDGERGRGRAGEGIGDPHGASANAVRRQKPAHEYGRAAAPDAAFDQVAGHAVRHDALQAPLDVFQARPPDHGVLEAQVFQPVADEPPFQTQAAVSLQARGVRPQVRLPAETLAALQTVPEVEQAHFIFEIEFAEQALLQKVEVALHGWMSPSSRGARWFHKRTRRELAITDRFRKWRIAGRGKRAISSNSRPGEPAAVMLRS